MVELPDGRRIRGTGARKARGDVPAPDFAVYLLGRELALGPWPYRWVRWRDFRLPDSTEDATAALHEAWDRAGEERVEIACRGGIGRTGTTLALLATLSGVAPEDAVAWVRAHYHRRAVGAVRVHAGVQSGRSQTTDLQRDALLSAGVESDVLYEDRASGAKEDRPELAACLKALRSGDTFLMRDGSTGTPYGPRPGAVPGRGRRHADNQQPRFRVRTLSAGGRRWRT